MAKILELIGSSGVGKTTIYNQISAVWKKSNNWIPGEMLFPKEKLSTGRYRVSILNVLRRIFLNKSSYDVTALDEAGSRFISLYPEYIDKAWHNISCTHKKNLNGSDLRFQKISYLNKIIQKIQILNEQDSNKIAIVDEGLVHLIATFLYDKEVSVQDNLEIQKFLEIIPLPHGIVSVETDLGENIKRLMHRKKIISLHKSLVKEQLEKVICVDHKRRLAVNEVLEMHNIPLLKINSSEDISSNVSKIRNFAAKINS